MSKRDTRSRAPDRRKLLAMGGVDADPRTAGGRRTYEIAVSGASTKISLNHFRACFRNKDERTKARLLAWAQFDEHAHRAHQGELPEPRFEVGIAGGEPGGITQNRLDALKADHQLAMWLGRDMHGLLTSVIYLGHDYRSLTGNGYGDERLIRGMFRRALDLAAAYWGLDEDQSFAQVLARINLA